MEYTRETLFGSGLTRGQKIKKSFFSGVNLGFITAAQDVAMIGFQASKAGRGEMVPAVVGQSIGIAAGIPLAGFASAALCLIPGIGPLTAAVIGTAMASYGEVRFGAAFTKKIRMFTNLNKSIRHLEMGGRYQDTEIAMRQRMIAINDMNSATMPARRYLGQEALLMHR